MQHVLTFLSTGIKIITVTKNAEVKENGYVTNKRS